MSDFEKLPTDVPGLDVLTRGGLPKGRTTLICGKSGTCKSVTALQIAANLARRGVVTLFFAVEEAREDLITTGDALGLELSARVRDGTIHIVDLTPPMEGPTIVTVDYDVSGLVHRIEATAREHRARAIVLDSATALFSPRPPEALLRSHFFHLVHTFRKLDLTAIVTAEAPGDYGQLTTLGVEDFVCDLVIVLRNLVDGERRRRSIEVHKYRRSSHPKGEYPCTITAKGITVFPLDATPSFAMDAATRFSSGLAGLDSMNNGGWLRDSIVLVRGPSGSGKTTMAGMYARAGARRGERVVYYGFEETKPILMRNFASIGMPLEALEANGTLKVECRYPEATSPEDLLVEIRSGLDEFKPSLIVFDSISSIEHSNSARGFRQLMVGMAALLREHGRSALLTQTLVAGDRDAAAPYLSTIPDAILLLDYDIDSPAMNRTLRVLKMRGSAHVTEKRRLHIGPGGLTVDSKPGDTERTTT